MIIKDHETKETLFIADLPEDVRVGEKLRVDFDCLTWGNRVGFAFWEITNMEDDIVYVKGPGFRLE